MNTVMGLINLQEDSGRIKELTENRPIGSVLPEQSRSVMDHLRSGKDWDLARRHEGMFYLPPAKGDKDTRPGDLKTFYQNIDFVEHSAQKYVLLTSAS